MRPARACAQTHLSVDAALGSLLGGSTSLCFTCGAAKWLVRRSELEWMLGSQRPAGSDRSGAAMRPTMPGDRLIIDSGSGKGPDG